MTLGPALIRRNLTQAVKDRQARRELTGRVLRHAQRGLLLPRRAAGHHGLPELPELTLPAGPVARPGLRVAVVLDAFTTLALGYEWHQVPVTPQDWRRRLETDPPQLLFVESAWQGNGGAWRLAMTGSGGPSVHLRELVAWCRAHGIPTVFWNKEDPPGYDRFLQTARLFDQVFTVDADRVPHYVQSLGHDRVEVLPFAAQPRIHNPVQHWSRGRAHEVAFAGSYFVEKHPARRAQMDYVLGAALEHGLHLYSRMDEGDARYRFPAAYRRHIVGTLPYERMLAASTAYKVFLNVNSVTDSPTMCARRLFELSAAQTPVVSGPAAAIGPVFGHDITVVRDVAESRTALRALLHHPELRDRQGLRAHRRVHQDHLYRHRVDQVLQAVGLPTAAVDRSISAVVSTRRPGQLDHVLDTVAAQHHPDLELVLVAHGFELDAGEVSARASERGLSTVQVLHASADTSFGACMNLGVQAASGRYVAKMDDDNYYGPHYLSDLVEVFGYTDAAVTGKWAHYAHLRASGATLLRFPGAEHRTVELVQGGTILTTRDLALAFPFEPLPRRVDTTFLAKIRRAGGAIHAADRFNFVSVRGPSAQEHTWTISDTELMSRQSRLVFYGDPREHVTV